MSATATLHGLAELKRNFEALEKKAQDTIMRKAARSGAAPIRKGMRELAPKRTGDLRKSIKTVVRKKPFGHVSITGPSDDFRGGPTPGSTTRINIPRNYIHLVEFGFTAPDGSTVPAEPFARPAYDQNKRVAADVAVGTMRVELWNEARKLKVTHR